MGLGDVVRGQLVEIVEWSDDSRDTLSFRFPDEDRAIKRGARLIVRESQQAQFVYLGQFGDTFGPGAYRLTTDTIPILTALRGWQYGFESPFKADVYFVTTRLFTGLPWGTANPVMVRDAELGVVRLRAFGTYDMRVTDVPRFLREVSGTDAHFTVAEFSDAIRSRLVGAFSAALATSGVPVADVAGRYRELGEALLPAINPVVSSRYGVELASFVVENVSVPPEVEQSLDKRAGMAAVGDLNAFVKYQMGLGLEREGAGVAAAGAQMGVGLAMAQQLAGPAVDVLTPADVARLLKVPEADVLKSLEAGDLKGTRVGSAWRVTRAALDQFLG
jgi:excisionase family DNA binding protein